MAYRRSSFDCQHAIRSISSLHDIECKICHKRVEHWHVIVTNRESRIWNNVYLCSNECVRNWFVNQTESKDRCCACQKKYIAGPQRAPTISFTCIQIGENFFFYLAYCDDPSCATIVQGWAERSRTDPVPQARRPRRANEARRQTKRDDDGWTHC